jgi:HSP20 family molecular chaperone IbpA
LIYVNVTAGTRLKLKSVPTNGNLYCSCSLDSAVDEAGGSAKYKDGVLEMVLPKKNCGGPTKLQVSWQYPSRVFTR